MAGSRPPLAEALDLERHPEGGWFRRTWTSDVVLDRGDDQRPSATAILYLLADGEQSQWHRVRSAELWLHHRGPALELRLGGSGDAPPDQAADVTTVVLGPDVEAGQQPQVLVPPDTWQAAGPATGDVLVSCVVSPGFDFADWRLARTGAEPVPFEVHPSGAWLHGTKADLAPGDLLVPGRTSNFEEGRTSNHVYVTATLDAAAWGAELATGTGPGRVYVVEPTGPLEDDPNVTDQKFPGNPTRSFRTREPVRVVEELTGWVGHSPETQQRMRDGLAALQARGEAVILD